MPAPDPNLFALLKLLADDHPPIVEAARAKLVELGEAAIACLTEAVLSHQDPKVRVEAKGVLERIRLSAIRRQWKGFLASDDRKLDLEEGAFLMARVSYPDLDPSGYRKHLDLLAERVQGKLKASKDPKVHLKAINQVLFRDEKFRGNWADYFDPQNSYLNCVLDRKLGIPISLSVLYLLVARRLRIPVKGVGVPGHFMVKYRPPGIESLGSELFIDAFNEGRILSRAQCVQFVVEAGYPYQKEFLDGVGPREILARMLRNLILIYVDRHEETLERTLTQFLHELYPEEPAGPEAQPES